MVRTNPPGANVYVDHQLVGKTPISTSFLYYGKREIEVVADGYRTEKVVRNLSPPWYQIPPLDFISETLWPWEIRDERIIDITMIPHQAPSSEELLARGESLRLQASQGITTTLPPTMAGAPDFRDQTVIPGGLIPRSLEPTRPIDPTFSPNYPQTGVFPPGTNPMVNPSTVLPQARDAFGNIIRPGGQPPTRIPETGILPGGGYRPQVPSSN